MAAWSTTAPDSVNHCCLLPLSMGASCLPQKAPQRTRCVPLLHQCLACWQSAGMTLRPTLLLQTQWDHLAASQLPHLLGSKQPLQPRQQRQPLVKQLRMLM